MSITLAWEKSRNLVMLPLFSHQMTSEKRVQKFYTDDGSLPWSGLCFWLVESNFPHSTTNQKHYPDLGSDVSSVWNFCACSQTSFGGETRGRIAKCQLFSQANITSTYFRVLYPIVIIKEFLPDQMNAWSTSQDERTQKMIIQKLRSHVILHTLSVVMHWLRSNL